MVVRSVLLCGGLVLACWGCAGETPTPGPAVAPPVAPPVAGASSGTGTTAGTASAQPPASAPAPGGSTAVPAAPPRISLGGGRSSSATAGSTESAGNEEDFTREEVLAALKPMQILRDQWNALRKQSTGSQDVGEEHVWIWDHRTVPKQPALVMESPDSKYLRAARLSYHPGRRQFEMTLTDADDQVRYLTGDFSEPVREVELDGKKLHRVYKLALTEDNPADPKDQWRVVLNQQENNRYLLEMERMRRGSFQRFETISAQRDGTSFALSDSDYGDRTCIISGGLGTIQVSFSGKNYWVCCTGCQAAFNEEPARWVAEFEAKQKDMPR